MKVRVLTDSAVRTYFGYELDSRSDERRPVRESASVIANPDHVQTIEVDRGGLFASRKVLIPAYSRASITELEGGLVEIVGEREDEADSQDCLLSVRFHGSHTVGLAMMNFQRKYQMRLSLELKVKRLLDYRKRNFFKSVDEVSALAVMAPGDTIVVTLTCIPCGRLTRFFHALRGIELKEVRTIEYFGGEPVLSAPRRTDELARMVDAGDNLMKKMVGEMERSERANSDT